MLVKKILLIELVKQGEATLESGELSVIFQQPQTNGVERAEVHLIQIELDVQLGQSVGDASGQLACGFVGESDNQQRLRDNPFLCDEIDDTLDQRKGLARAGARDDEHRAIGGEDGFELLGIDRALAGLQVSSNLINRENLIRLVAHLVTLGPLLMGWSSPPSCHKMT